MTMIWHPLEIEQALSAGIHYREQLRREALAREQEREARGERIGSELDAEPLSEEDIQRTKEGMLEWAMRAGKAISQQNI